MWKLKSKLTIYEVSEYMTDREIVIQMHKKKIPDESNVRLEFVMESMKENTVVNI